MKNSWKFYAIVAICLVATLYGSQMVQQQARLVQFGSRYPSGGQMRQLNRKRAPKEQRAYVARKRAFAHLWSRRHQRDVSAQIMPFLRDSEMSLREQSVRALGRLESKAALPQLMALKNRMATTRKQANVSREQWEQIKAVPDFSLDLAIARIKSRGRTGQSKLDYLMQGVGLQWNDLPPITRRAWYISDGTQPPPRFPATPSEKALIREVVDVLYQMKSKGQNITPWTKQLALAPPEKIWISTATMSRKKALRTLLDHISTLRIVREQEEVLTNSIYLTIGSDALPAMRQRLAYLVAHPNSRVQRNGTVQLIRAVSYAGDFQAIPILKKFTQDKDLHIRGEAQDSIKDIEENKFYVYAPM